MIEVGRYNGVCVQVDACVIGGVCYKANAVNPNNKLELCIPDKNPSDWSSITGMT